MSNDLQGIMRLIREISGQANILTIPRIFVDLTGDIKSALFLSQCIYWSSRSANPGTFYKTYQEWQKELGLGRYEIDNCRKQVSRWVQTELRKVNGAPVLHYTVDIVAITNDLLNYLTGDSQIHLSENSKLNCEKPANGFAGNQQNGALAIKCNLTETTTETTTEITSSSNGFATAAVSAKQKQKSKSKKTPTTHNIPNEVKENLQRIGWRGSLEDVETAWREDPERVRQWLWYAGTKGWSGALLRTVLRNPGEYPPELDPTSDYYKQQRRRSYLTGKYADYIEH